MDLISLIKELIANIVIVSWLLFILSWIIGWTIKGAPIPIGKARRIGQGLVEDAIWGAFWVAIGSTVFWLIYYIASQLGTQYPSPPYPQIP